MRAVQVFSVPFFFASLLLLSVFPTAPCDAQSKNRDANPKAKRAERTPNYPPKFENAREEIYKTVNGRKLPLYIFEPKDHKPTDRRPAIVFFFGGGWTSGSPSQFQHQCEHLASRGMVAITADYRVASRDQVRAVDCVRDAKSAMRWVRANAERLGVNPDRIAAAGGSAGGHLAACTAVIDAFDEESEDMKVSSKPNALVLFNPALALAPEGEATDEQKARAASIEARAGVEPKRISPAHQVREKTPPTIIFFGTDDDLLDGAEVFAKKMRELGNACELVTYPGEKHGFFNYGRGDNSSYEDTLKRSDAFLTSLGWLSQ